MSRLIRLMKFTAYLFFGYFLYEVFRGIGGPVRPRQTSRRSESHLSSRGHDEDLLDEPVWESSGARRRQKVGRGVVR